MRESDIWKRADESQYSQESQVGDKQAAERNLSLQQRQALRLTELPIMEPALPHLCIYLK